jgi:hypothetical protein
MLATISDFVGIFAGLQRLRSFPFFLVFAGMPGFTLTALGAIDVQPLGLVYIGHFACSRLIFKEKTIKIAA